MSHEYPIFGKEITEEDQKNIRNAVERRRKKGKESVKGEQEKTEVEKK